MEDDMASRGNSPTVVSDEEENVDVSSSNSSNYSEDETILALDLLLANISTYMSGNGFKKKALTDISDTLKKKYPNRPVRSESSIRNRLGHIKRVYERYEFVRGRSGVGWDDEEKKATAEAEFIKRFIEEHGAKYKNCFEKTCPYYGRLALLFGGNKATGAHVLHLKTKNKPKKSTASSATAASSSVTTSSATSTL
ncbi:Myb-DNA-bind-3 domain-containing protein [Mycena sanguinolenta]|uniref:Myb-DNA-bind-3 domain-containing protein n=1 Tax=Mycena sanguinolenta TaxID=230812 RepID=A0A8H6WSV0_9AGAR|nr:Myb-DNA-bind-3 domain-containing protein [Mycena sanguinolenta]